ncbi:TatD family hydrolase [soil metagenome]
MILTDTHTHLYSKEFDKDRREVIQKAIVEDITRFFIPAIDSSHTPGMYALEADFPDNIFLMMGLHPTSVKENYKEELEHVKEQFLKRKFFAVGETGIDLFWDSSFLNQQKEAFNFQIELAKKLDLPIVIHCRDAFNEIFEVLESQKDELLYGIFHCFTGNFNQAQKALSFNMKLGIGGVATFKNGGLDKFLKEIPLQHIVLETDAPYLSPVPYRGKRNESVYLKNVAQKVAEIYGISLDEVASVTTQNSREVFKV